MRTFIRNLEAKAVIHHGPFAEPVWLTADSFSTALDLVASNSWQYPNKGLSPSRLKILTTLLRNLLVSESRRQWLKEYCLVIYHRVGQTDTGEDSDFTKRDRVNKVVNLVKIKGPSNNFRYLIINLADFVGLQLLDVNMVGVNNTSAWTKVLGAWWKPSKSSRFSLFGKHGKQRLSELGWQSMENFDG